MHQKWVITIALFSMLYTSSDAQEHIPEQINRLAEDYVSATKNHGLVIAVQVQNRIAFKGYGQLSQTDTSKPDKSTLFEIGASTGVFTTTLMMLEAYQGTFDIGERIERYLPEGVHAPRFQPYVCSEKPHANYPRDLQARIVTCEPNWLIPARCITFCDLASHSSGLRNEPKGLYSWNPFKNVRLLDDPYRNYSRDDLYGSLHKYELASAPGTAYRFSNTGMALLGNLLVDIAEMPYERLLEKHLATQVDIHDTRVTLTEKQHSRMAPPHNLHGRSVVRWHFKAMAPAAGLKSTASDLAKFVQANLFPPAQDMADAFAQIHQPRIDVRDQEWHRETSIGYGWFISPLNETSRQQVTWIHGSTGGYRSFMGFMKDSGIGVVILSNSANDVDHIGFEIMEILQSVIR